MGSGEESGEWRVESGEWGEEEDGPFAYNLLTTHSSSLERRGKELLQGIQEQHQSDERMRNNSNPAMAAGYIFIFLRHLVSSDREFDI